MEMWVSKDALSGGVRKVEGEVSRVSGDYFIAPNLFLRIGKDAHPTEAEAIAAAEGMRQKKIASLQKQIARLEKLTF